MFKFTGYDGANITRLGRGLVNQEGELIEMDVAWATGSYLLSATARPGGEAVRLAGGKYEDGKLGGIEGTIKATLPQALTTILNRFLKDVGQVVFRAGAEAMYAVLQEAVENAPFWDKKVKWRPKDEGIHLQESGTLYYGMGEDKIIAKVENILGTERDGEVSRDEVVKTPAYATIVNNPNIKHREIPFWVGFYRINPRTGWDVALVRHEDLNHPRSKYLEKAFQQIRPDELVTVALSNYVKSIGLKQSEERKAMALVAKSLKRGDLTWKGV
jgi:hypothetical protein